MQQGRDRGQQVVSIAIFPSSSVLHSGTESMRADQIFISDLSQNNALASTRENGGRHREQVGSERADEGYSPSLEISEEDRIVDMRIWVL